MKKATEGWNIPDIKEYLTCALRHNFVNEKKLFQKGRKTPNQHIRYFSSSLLASKAAYLYDLFSILDVLLLVGLPCYVERSISSKIFQNGIFVPSLSWAYFSRCGAPRGSARCSESATGSHWNRNYFTSHWNWFYFLFLIFDLSSESEFVLFSVFISRWNRNWFYFRF